MEAPAIYEPAAARPRLTVVRDGGVQGRFSALPHDIIRNTGISRDARLLVSVLLMYGWQGSEITASHATLAADMGCGLKSLRGYLDELIEAQIVIEHDAGVRRQKVYRLTVNTLKTAHWETVNTAETADCQPSNAQFLPVQSVVLDASNTSKTTDSKKKTPEKKTKEIDTAPTEPAGAREREVFDYFRSKIQPSARVFKPEKIRARLKRFTLDELKAGIDNFAADWWWMDNNAARGADWFFHSDQRSEQFLNLKPRPSREAPQRSGNDRMPPGAASKQRSSWTDFKGRHGYHTNAASEARTDGR